MKNKSNTSKLDWSNFHFLENLFAFCACNSRSVPAESGVKFHLNAVDNGRAICMLFHIDRESDPLIPHTDGPRPDYVVFYLTSELFICTIIEMKGKSEKNLSHGIDQIKAFRARLKTEISKHLPARLKTKFQGILLSPYNSDIPREKILKEEKSGLIILTPQANHSADLSTLVTKQLKLTDRLPTKTTMVRGRGFNFMEEILINGVKPKRIKDSFYGARYQSDSQDMREGLYINYNIEKSSYAVLATSQASCTIGVKGPHAKIESWLRRAGFPVNTHILLEPI